MKIVSNNKNIGIDTKIKSLECSGPKLPFHSLKSFLASYSPSTLFLTFRWVWDFLKWFQMIPHAQKPGAWHQNQVSSLTRTKVRLLLSLDMKTKVVQHVPRKKLDNLTTWQLDNLTTWQLDNLTTWQPDNLTTWQLDTFEHRHENNGCSACLKDQTWQLDN